MDEIDELFKLIKEASCQMQQEQVKLILNLAGRLTFGRDHMESSECWCGPELRDDFTESGGVKHYLHKEIQ